MRKPAQPVLSKNRRGEPNPLPVVLQTHAGAARNCGLRTIEKTMRAAAEYIRRLEEYVAHLESAVAPERKGES